MTNTANNITEGLKRNVFLSNSINEDSAALPVEHTDFHYDDHDDTHADNGKFYPDNNLITSKMNTTDKKQKTLLQVAQGSSIGLKEVSNEVSGHEEHTDFHYDDHSNTHADNGKFYPDELKQTSLQKTQNVNNIAQGVMFSSIGILENEGGSDIENIEHPDHADIHSDTHTDSHCDQ